MKKFILWGTLLFSQFAFSQTFENLGSISTALGGAGAGAVNSVDGVFNNPAALGVYNQRSAALSFAHNSVRASLSDNGADALFPAMLGYHQSDIDGTKVKAFYLGLAYPMSNQFSIGVNFGFQEIQLESVTGKFKQTLADVGMIYRTSEWFSVGAVLKNKPLNDTALSNTIDDQPATAAGFELNYENMVKFRSEVESGKNLQDEQKEIYKSGIEVAMNEWLQLRLGYQNNNIISQNYFTAGLGFSGPQFGLHYGYVKGSEFATEGKDAKEAYHSIDLAVPF